MDRRKFLKNTLSGLAAASLSGALPTRAKAQAGESGATNVLFVVDLGGGADTYSTCPPYPGELYDFLYTEQVMIGGTLRARRPDLFIDPADILPIGPGSYPRGLHPSWLPLQEILPSIRLIDNVGFPANRDRSHESARQRMQFQQQRPDFADGRGWIGRASDERGASAGFALGGNMSSRYDIKATLENTPIVAGDIDTFGFSKLTGRATVPFGSGDANQSTDDEDDVLIQETLARAVENQREDDRPHFKNWAENHTKTVPLVAKLANYKNFPLVGDYHSGGTPTTFQNTCKDASRVALSAMNDTDYAGLPLIIVLERGGWDTHSNQASANSLTSNVTNVARGLKGIIQDLRANSVGSRGTIVCLTEFGRQYTQNGGLGTDHGLEQCVTIFGDAVQTGYTGQFPDVSTATGNAFPATVDIQSVIGALLNWAGFNESVILPGFTPLSGIFK